jgi:hypothetical protein
MLLTARRPGRKWAAEVGMDKLQDVVDPMRDGGVRVTSVLRNYARLTPVQH